MHRIWVENTQHFYTTLCRAGQLAARLEGTLKASCSQLWSCWNNPAVTAPPVFGSHPSTRCLCFYAILECWSESVPQAASGASSSCSAVFPHSYNSFYLWKLGKKMAWNNRKLPFSEDPPALTSILSINPTTSLLPTFKCHVLTRDTWFQALSHTVASHSKLMTPLEGLIQSSLQVFRDYFLATREPAMVPEQTYCPLAWKG